MSEAADELAARWAAFWDASALGYESDLYAEQAQIEDGQRGPESRKTGAGLILSRRNDSLRRISDQRVTAVRSVAAGEWTAVEFVVQGTDEADTIRHAQPGVAWLRVDPEGRITFQRSYFEWQKRRPDRGSAAGRVYLGSGRQRSQAWYRGFAERLAELWATDYVRMCNELYAEDQTLDLMGGAPESIQRNRKQLLAAETSLHERIPVRKMTVFDVAGEAGLLAFTHVIVSARSWQARQRYWPVCLVLTLDGDDRVISDHSYVMDARPGAVPPELAPLPPEEST
jgi:hypothetical protein